MRKSISILGSTGSVGVSTLSIIDKKKNYFKVHLLSANKNFYLIEKQIKKYKPKIFVITNKVIYDKIKKRFSKKKIIISNTFNELILSKKIDITISAIPGIVGLEPTIQMVKSSKKILIANKESIICGWHLIKKTALKYNTKIIPIDSEHFSILKLLENHSLKEIEKGPQTHSIIKTLIGNSDLMAKLKAQISNAASSALSVMILGDTGTGKELVAHWLHEKSTRSKGALIEVNCAAIPSELIESELFGHVKGAFTSANKDRAGKFEAANGGTIFLDEIGDMSLSAQAKVLRALQESRIQRVGSDKDIKVNVRVVAATNKNLKKEIQEGNFREDLYHRLAVILIKVPSLNDRREDIPLLIDYFSRKIGSEQGTVKKDFSKSAIKLLQAYDWTGNIRELRNVVERLIILGEQEISESDVRLFASK